MDTSENNGDKDNYRGMIGSSNTSHDYPLAIHKEAWKGLQNKDKGKFILKMGLILGHNEAQ